jgi:hypothetical protein
MPKPKLVYRSWSRRLKYMAGYRGWYVANRNDPWGYGPFDTRAEAYRCLKTVATRDSFMPSRQRRSHRRRTFSP